MNKIALGILCAAMVGATASHPTLAQGKGDWSFQRVGTFANYRNAPIGDKTVSEIIAATADGKTIVYTDSERGTVGFIDITNPASPRAAGTVSLDPDPADGTEYSPTSVDVLRSQYALVAADTSASKTDASGSLLVIDIATRAIVAQIDLGGQPDSVKVSPDHRFVAIAIENERDEALCVGGSDNGSEIVDDDDYTGASSTTTEDLCEDGDGVPGGMPQTAFGNPAGYLAVIETAGNPASWIRRDVAFTGLTGLLYPTDPEPEFVDINQANQAVVTLQENNHVVVVDLPSRMVVADFPAGAVTLNGVDANEDDVISLTDTLANVPREPDAVTWVADNRIATANEGDLNGGSRGFTIFNTNGSVVHDSGTSFERLAVRFGHYPEARSENKGSEPESIASAKFGPNDLLFVGSERGSFVAVFRVDRDGQPAFSQLLPGPLKPEGLLAIPHRNLLVASGEKDDPSFGVRSTVMIYELKPGQPTYPQILSADDGAGSPIAWSALSGMTEIPGVHDQVQAIWDSFYSESRIFTVDVTRVPAVITDTLTITGGGGNYDPEGLAYAPDGSLWVASEGNAKDSRPNRLLKVNPATGAVEQEIGLPAAVLACRAAERAKPAPNGTGSLGSGFEGLDILPTGGGSYLVYVAQQRGWNYTTSAACDALDDDPADTTTTEPAWTRIWIYNPQAATWSHVRWQLAPKPANASWVGLSEITLVDGGWILIERDNRTGDFGALKTLAKVDFAAAADGAFANSEKSVYDLRPRLTATNGWITDKPEGVAVLPDGRLFVVTDNDGVDDWSGETWFLSLGRFWTLFE